MGRARKPRVLSYHQLLKGIDTRTISSDEYQSGHGENFDRFGKCKRFGGRSSSSFRWCDGIIFILQIV